MSEFEKGGITVRGDGINFEAMEEESKSLELSSRLEGIKDNLIDVEIKLEEAIARKNNKKIKSLRKEQKNFEKEAEHIIQELESYKNANSIESISKNREPVADNPETIESDVEEKQDDSEPNTIKENDGIVDEEDLSEEQIRQIEQLKRELAVLRRDEKTLVSPSLIRVTEKNIQEIEKKIRALEENGGIADEMEVDQKVEPVQKTVEEQESEEEKWDNIKSIYEKMISDYKKADNEESAIKTAGDRIIQLEKQKAEKDFESYKPMLKNSNLDQSDENVEKVLDMHLKVFKKFVAESEINSEQFNVKGNPETESEPIEEDIDLEKITEKEVETEEILTGSEKDKEKYYGLEKEKLEKIKSFLNEEEGKKIEGNWSDALFILYNTIGLDFGLSDYSSIKGFNVHQKYEDSVLVCVYYESEIYDIDIAFKENGISVAVEKKQAVQKEKTETAEEIPSIDKTQEEIKKMKPEELDEEIEKIKKYLKYIKKEAGDRDIEISEIDKYQEFEEYLDLLASAKKELETEPEESPEEKPEEDEIKEPKKIELNEAKKEYIRKSKEIEKLRKENEDIFSIPEEDLTDEQRKTIERVEELEIGRVLDKGSAIMTNHVDKLERKVGMLQKGESILEAQREYIESRTLLVGVEMLEKGLRMKMERSKKKQRTYLSVGKMGNAVKERLKNPFGKKKKKEEKEKTVKTISETNERFSIGKRKDLDLISEQDLMNEFETVLEDIKYIVSTDEKNKEIIEDVCSINIKKLLNRINTRDDIKNDHEDIKLFFEKAKIKIEKLPDDLSNPKKYLDRMLNKINSIFKEKIGNDNEESVEINENQINEQQDSDFDKFKIEIIEQLKDDEGAVQELGELVGFADFVINKDEKIGKFMENGMEDNINNKELKELLEKERTKNLTVKEAKEIYNELKIYRNNLNSDQNDEIENDQVEIETTKRLEISRILLANDIKTKDFDEITKILDLNLNKVSRNDLKSAKVDSIPRNKINNEKHRQIIKDILDKDNNLSIIDLKNIIEDVRTKK